MKECGSKFGIWEHWSELNPWLNFCCVRHKVSEIAASVMSGSRCALRGMAEDDGMAVADRGRPRRERGRGATLSLCGPRKSCLPGSTCREENQRISTISLSRTLSCLPSFPICQEHPISISWFLYPRTIISDKALFCQGWSFSKMKSLILTAIP